MEVKVGYRQTDVGVIPDDWECVRICDVARLESGHTPRRTVNAYWNGSIPWVSLHDTDSLEQNYIYDTTMTVTQHGIDNSSARLLPAGTVVFSRTATVGKATILGREMATSQDFANYVCGPKLCNLYAVYLLRAMTRTWESLMAGSTHKTIYMPTFEKLQIPLPSVAEQEEIAAALADVDGLLAEVSRLIAKKRDLKQAAMQQLLTGQTRLPGFTGEWKNGCLADVIGRLEAGVSVNSTEDFGDAARYERSILKTSAVAAGRFIPHECKRIAARDVSRARLNPRRDTLLISRMNTPDLVGECGYVDRDYPNLFVPDRLWLARFRQSADLDPLWLSYLLCTPRLKRWVRSAATGTSGSMKNLSKRAFLAIPTAFPPGREQTAIAEVLSDMDAEIAALQARRNKTNNLKQAMMQELLTGKTRLPRSETVNV
jgi:type I restriction enzyme, S subunit